MLHAPIAALFAVLHFAVLLVVLFSLIDAAIRPAAAYPAVQRRTKGFWAGILAVAALFAVLPFGVFALFDVGALVAAVVYLVDVRPKLRQVGRGGQRNGPYSPW